MEGKHDSCEECVSSLVLGSSLWKALVDCMVRCMIVMYDSSLQLRVNRQFRKARIRWNAYALRLESFGCKSQLNGIVTWYRHNDGK